MSPILQTGPMSVGAGPLTAGGAAQDPQAAAPKGLPSAGWKASVALHSLFLTRKVASTSATLSGLSSCTVWPTAGNTCIWNFPCICPTVRSLSSRSTPASSNSLAALASRNRFESPWNQPDQWRSEAARSTLQE